MKGGDPARGKQSTKQTHACVGYISTHSDKLKESPYSMAECIVVLSLGAGNWDLDII